MAVTLVLSGKISMKLIHEASSIEIFCSPATQVRVSVEAGAGEVIEGRVRLLEFLIGP